MMLLLTMLIGTASADPDVKLEDLQVKTVPSLPPPPPPPPKPKPTVKNPASTTVGGWTITVTPEGGGAKVEATKKIP